MRPFELAALGLLLAAALGVGLLARSPEGETSRPVLDDRGPQGLAVLRTWLEGQGVTVERWEREHGAPAAGVGTVVLAAFGPTPVDDAEVRALEAFATSGGTVVLLLPSSPSSQPALRRWLGVELGTLERAGVVNVARPHGVFSGVATLPFGGGAVPELDAPAIAVTQPAAVWWRPFGAGEVITAVGTELASNHRLESGDAARLWANLGRHGAIAFDEGHLRAVEPPGWTVNFLAVAGQLGLVALAVAWSFGRRLGPPAPAPMPELPSSAQAISASASLTLEARVEPELAAALRHRWHAELAERLGRSAEVPFAELAAGAADRSGTGVHTWLALDARLDAARGAVSPEGYVALVREVVALDEALARGKGMSRGTVD